MALLIIRCRRLMSGSSSQSVWHLLSYIHENWISTLNIISRFRPFASRYIFSLNARQLNPWTCYWWLTLIIEAHKTMKSGRLLICTITRTFKIIGYFLSLHIWQKMFLAAYCRISYIYEFYLETIVVLFLENIRILTKEFKLVY